MREERVEGSPQDASLGCWSRGPHLKLRVGWLLDALISFNSITDQRTHVVLLLWPVFGPDLL
jgi:hypothetical protein